MVATFLQNELADELKRILSDIQLKTPQGGKSSINIFEQLLPMPEPSGQEEIAPELLENGLAEEQTAPDPYPYIVVRIADGEIEDENSAQKVNLTLLIGIYEPDYDKQGHRDILNIIAKIYERFAKFPVLNGKYTVQYPILWTLQDEESYPFYFGGVNLGFEVAAIRREDPYS
ncbi:MAG: hypothetical protein NC548_39400 [Lachnospiraceae bacterium]|nr:hypothetical protein [Lachnospiraceae bacterium]